MSVIIETAPQAPVADVPRRTWRRFLQHRVGVIGFGMLAVAVFVAVFAPFIAPYDPYAPVNVTIFDIYQPPSPAHILGTDDGGKDVYSSLLYGARVSLTVGFTAAAIAILIGAVVGIVAGYRRGWIGSLLMRITDFFLVIPDLALMIVLVAIIGPSLVTIILVIGFLGWTGSARLIRSQTLSVRERKYVMRAKAVGAGDIHILRRHILPAVLPLMLANMVLVVSIAILDESSLAFLGLGDPTVISWGQMLNYAFERGAISAGAWWALLAPGFAIVWVVLGTTLLGTALEDAVNPRLKRHHLEAPGSDVAPDRPISQPPPFERGPDAPILRVRDLTIEFASEQGPLRAVDHVSFDLRRGETLGLVGESGCGKTTTVLGLLRLLPPGGMIVDGSVWFDGDDLVGLDGSALRAFRWTRLSLVFQGAMNALNPVRSVGDQISEAIRLHCSGHDEGPGRRADRRAPGASRHLAPARPRVPAYVLRRHAPARDDRPRARLRPRRHRGRRADHRARRDDPGPDPGASRRDRPRLRDGDHPRHARPRRGGPGLRPHRRDVRRHRGGGERCGHALP